MTFISYAQNFEDVMLWRALKNIENGFYIDVGANDPAVDSVTKYFYDHGWHGVNVEPLKQHYDALQVERPRDINLNCAAGRSSGEIDIFECDVRGWATADQRVRDRHVQEGHDGVCHRVPLRTLSDICDEYVTGEIHFLKIDVEGFEKEVITGADLRKFRPWIMIVEATKPNSMEEVYEEWDGLLTGAGYLFAYADGLNRFYVAVEHSELIQFLKYPPNVFDDFIRADQLNFELRVQQAVTWAQQEAARAQQFEVRAQDAETRAQLLNDSFMALSQQLAELNQTVKVWRRETESLRVELAEVKSARDQLQIEHRQEQERSRWLQNEWEAAKAKINELNQSSHHWWTVSDGLNRELQDVYKSKSWRLTLPLRKGPQIFKGMLALPVRIIHWTISLPKRTILWLLVKVMAFVLKNPVLKCQAEACLRKHPKLEVKLYGLALARGLVAPPLSKPISVLTFPESNVERSIADVSALGLPTLTPRARRIYFDLKVALEKRQKEQG
jgi:FkbM family methyltransferase